MSQTVPSFPANPFTQVNVSKESGISSYDNAELIEMNQSVYHFAQQKESKIIKHLVDVGSSNALFIEKPRFGKFEWSQRSSNYADTPHSVHQNSMRASSLVNFELGNALDRDQINQTIYKIQPRIQMEATKSLGRTIDRGIIEMMGHPVLQYSSTASASFSGVKTASTVALPRESVIAFSTTASADTLIRWTGFAVDELVKDFEMDDWEAGDICVLMTPEVRRQLKKIPDFRDAENNQSFYGRENMDVIRWRDITWIYISNSVAPPITDVLATRRFQADTQFAKTVASGGTLVTGYTNYAQRLVTYAFTKPSIMWRMGGSGLYSRVGVRMDKSDAVELYMRASFGGLRVDDTGVRQIVFGTNEPGTGDQQ